LRIAQNIDYQNFGGTQAHRNLGEGLFLHSIGSRSLSPAFVVTYKMSLMLLGMKNK